MMKKACGTVLVAQVAAIERTKADGVGSTALVQDNGETLAVPEELHDDIKKKVLDIVHDYKSSKYSDADINQMLRDLIDPAGLSDALAILKMFRDHVGRSNGYSALVEETNNFNK